MDTVSEVIGDLLGAECTIRTVVTSEYKPAPTTNISKEEFTALAEELGGVVHEGE